MGLAIRSNKFLITQIAIVATVHIHLPQEAIHRAQVHLAAIAVVHQVVVAEAVVAQLAQAGVAINSKT